MTMEEIITEEEREKIKDTVIGRYAPRPPKTDLLDRMLDDTISFTKVKMLEKLEPEIKLLEVTGAIADDIRAGRPFNEKKYTKIASRNSAPKERTIWVILGSRKQHVWYASFDEERARNAFVKILGTDKRAVLQGIGVA